MSIIPFKYILLVLTLTIIGLNSRATSPLPAQPNPVALGLALYNLDNRSEITEFGKYYHLVVTNDKENQYQFSTLDGSKLEYKCNNIELDKQVSLTTHMSKRNVEKVLRECQFKKVNSNYPPLEYIGNTVYEKKGSGYAPYSIICILKKNNPIELTFLRIKKN